MTEDEIRDELIKITHWKADSVGMRQLMELVGRIKQEGIA